MFHNNLSSSFGQPSSTNINMNRLNNHNIFQNDENAIQRQHKQLSESAKPSKSSSVLKPKKSALLSININTSGKLNPNTPSQSATNTKRRALGDISNRKSTSKSTKISLKNGGGGGLGGANGLKSKSNGGGGLAIHMDNNVKMSMKKQSIKKKKVPSSNLKKKKSVTFDEQALKENKNQLKQRELLENRMVPLNQASSTNSSLQNEVDEIDDIEIMAGRSWLQEQEMLRDEPIYIPGDIESFRDIERDIEESIRIRNEKEFKEQEQACGRYLKMEMEQMKKMDEETFRLPVYEDEFSDQYDFSCDEIEDENETYLSNIRLDISF
mmetsp:Transcript_8911/g.9783  ORF Transcript_8911/g.9783 Transcript_8911/m.9783 type:complete len:324 (+) Transcript_8911:134-1105(+)